MSSTASFAVFDLTDTLLLIWRHETTLEGVEATRTTLEAMVAREPGKVMFLTIIEDDVGMKAPSEVRQALAEVLKRHGERISAAAVVLEATGFKATAIRSAVTAVSLASRPPFKEKVFSDLGTAIKWLANVSGQGGRKAEQLTRQVQGRRNLGAPVP